MNLSNQEKQQLNERIKSDPISHKDYIKFIRDLRLKECDWTQLPDVNLANLTEWITYRQALRDIPAQEGFPQNVVWPTKPV
jgi:hypothetical protein